MLIIIAVPRGGKTTTAVVAGITLGVPSRQTEAADGPWRREFRSGEYAAYIYTQKVSPYTNSIAAAETRRDAVWVCRLGDFNCAEAPAGNVFFFSRRFRVLFTPLWASLIDDALAGFTGL